VLARERHTGTLIFLASIRAILDYEPFKGIVAVDEAYIDFSEPGSSAVSLVAEYANICVMHWQTLSKSFRRSEINLLSVELRNRKFKVINSSQNDPTHLSLSPSVNLVSSVYRPYREDAQTRSPCNVSVYMSTGIIASSHIP